jgi:hypothetical protein
MHSLCTCSQKSYFSDILNLLTHISSSFNDWEDCFYQREKIKMGPTKNCEAGVPTYLKSYQTFYTHTYVHSLGKGYLCTQNMIFVLRRVVQQCLTKLG